MSDTADGTPANVWVFHGAGANFASGVLASFSPGDTEHVHVRDGVIDDHYGEG